MPKIFTIKWHPPPPSWIKLNSNGATRGAPGTTGVGGLFRNCRGVVKGCFIVPLSTTYAFVAEIKAAIYGIDKAYNFGWNKIWLESDSTYVEGSVS
ncbi:hypothetical protein RCOM_1732210 [Ricinus communis]|uniref:RNase H type-1 domain-containing protein n=1 Tax=Ricinus communis TaxID=3988 RepID=B9S889_RICCO|nr:hypothetical protein RCOM_1732210 [Ricinus communis]